MKTISRIIFVVCIALALCSTVQAQNTVVSGTGLLNLSSTPLTGFLTFQTNDCNGHAVQLVTAGSGSYNGVTVAVTAGAYSATIEKPSANGGGFCYQVGVYDSAAGTSRFLSGLGAYNPTGSTDSIAGATTTGTSPDSTVAPANSSVGGGITSTVGAGRSLVFTVAASGATQSITLVNGETVYDVTLSANCTFSFTPSTFTGSQQKVTLIIHPASFTATMPSPSGSFVWSGGSAPTISTSAVTVLTFTYTGTTAIIGKS